MRSEEARVGKSVRVKGESQDQRNLRPGRPVGTIERRYGNPAYVALEVRFRNGYSELFWHHELEEAKD